MLKWTDFGIGGYNFDSWSPVKELYVPTDVNSSLDRSLHLRGREALEHHLQHYVIPNDKKLVVFAITNALFSTASSIGLFGTGKAYGRYPEGVQSSGAPGLWDVNRSPNYYAAATWGILVVNQDNIVYECILTHVPEAAREPGYGGDWETYWHTHNEVWAVDWEVDKWYYFNELALVTVEGVEGAYMCMVDHTSSLDTKPCDGTWDTIWNPGDEFTPDLTSQFGFKAKCLNVSRGISNPFSRGILGIFDGSTGTFGRRVDAMTIGGTLTAGATLHGIEVDA